LTTDWPLKRGLVGYTTYFVDIYGDQTPYLQETLISQSVQWPTTAATQWALLLMQRH